MKTFSYIVRDTNGSLRRGTTVAVDRATALEDLRSKGWVPTAVQECEEGGRLARSDKLFKQIAIIILAGLGVASGLWVYLKMSGSQTNVRDTKRMRVEGPATGNKTVAVQSPELKIEKVQEPPKEVEPQHLQNKEMLEQPPVLQAQLPPKPAMPRLNATNKVGRVIVPGIRRNADTNTPNPYATFKTRSERMISMMVEAKPGERILDVSFGKDFDQDFLKSLENVIEIYPSDTEEMAAHKEQVARIKDEMRKLSKEGQSPEEILTTYRKQHNEIASYRDELQRQLTALKKEGKIQEAEEFAKEANKMLEPYGTRPLTVYPVIPRQKKP